MSLAMIKTAAGWVIDITELDVDDTIVIQAESWPHNFSGLDFKELGQIMCRGAAKGIYAATVDHKPNQGLQIAQMDKPSVVIFKSTKNPKHQ